MIEPIPIKQLFPIVVCPPIFTPGAIWEFLPILTSCSTMEAVLIMQFSSITQSVFIVTLAFIIVPFLILTFLEITAVGWINVANLYFFFL